MLRYKFKTDKRRINADLFTPAGVYLKLRDQYPNSILLESSDYDGQNKGYSYICCNPIASIEIKNRIVTYTYPHKKKYRKELTKRSNVAEILQNFARHFVFQKSDYDFITQGMFGYLSYEAVEHFENIELNKHKPGFDIPEIYYAIYQNIIAISLFNHQAYVFSHVIYDQDHNLEELINAINRPKILEYAFQVTGPKLSNLDDHQYKNMVERAKWHCRRGDVFQLVLSRRFSQGFKGDEFKVYRALRSINPSPYLFYFDYGSFKIFGSSPEAHLVVKDNKAEIHPIAGTFRRTGNHQVDLKKADKLILDSKENSEHAMLIDLARNDLSRNGSQVVLEKDREVQFFSHVIHLVSKVTAKLNADTSVFQLVADTFPAGTLSGAPKHKSLELIDNYENTKRDTYGGAIGYMDLNGRFDHAIIIRSFLSKSNNLHYQGGAGLVVDSVPERELEEVYNKLRALEQAIVKAQHNE